MPHRSGMHPKTREAELRAVGLHICNQWLADACSVEPERSVGLAQLPLWDLERSVAEAEWARGAGLGGINFPAPRHDLPIFDSLVWEDFWSVCAANDLPIVTHAGGGLDTRIIGGFGSYLLLNVEASTWSSRAGINFLTLGGVFSRHPNLKLVLTEQPGDWWLYTLRELDSVYERESATSEYKELVQLPSSYFGVSIFIGQSFMSHYEAQISVAKGLSDCMMWGSDYPHREGAYLYPEDSDALSTTKLALRETFHGVEINAIEQIAGGNAIRVFGLDRDKLQRVASCIGASPAAEIATPNDLRNPAVVSALELGRRGSYAFREGDRLHGGG